MNNRSIPAAAVAALILVAPLAACSSGSSSAADDGTTEVTWWTWDDSQAVSYGKCAEAFEAANPDIEITIEQYAWDDYWTKLTAGFVGGTAPDAFQDHPSYYPEFADQGQLLALDDYIAADDFDMSQYAVGLDTWGEYTDGSVYGLPKDWSALAFYYNADMLAEAGISADEMASLTWNPDDGGTFEQVVARLTVDDNGVRGDEAGFDKDNVAVYGMSTLTGGGINGQDTWAQFAPTTGWTLADEANWPTTFQYSDPDYVATAEWILSLVDKGYTPGYGETTLGAAELLGSGTTAMVQAGSWDATTISALDGVDVVAAPSPIGPSGERASLSGSMADSIWSGTDSPDETWQWISYMGTEECQTLAGADGTFLPSIAASMTASEATLAEQGVDLSVFTVHLEDGTLWEAPLYSGGTEIESTVAPMSEEFWSGTADSSIFAEMDAASAEIFASDG
ncbi:MAG TPA: sugar ABC transporter substrate-binding protein [Cellulomonas sp.]